MENKFIRNLVTNVNKQNAKEVSKNILTAVENGELDILEVYASLKRLDKIVETTIGAKGDKPFKELVLEETRKFTKDNTTCSIYGLKFNVRPVYTFYAYDNCNDPVWNSLNTVLKKVKKLMSDREKELQTIPMYDGNNLARAYRTEIIEKVYDLEVLDCGEEYNLQAPDKRQREGVVVNV